ncbi:hypothetical protein [Terrabacter sp. MAHUQ-38]|nr:hypothetical protein [Terrabacter sp. MAHUQ-38]
MTERQPGTSVRQPPAKRQKHQPGEHGQAHRRGLVRVTDRPEV